MNTGSAWCDACRNMIRNDIALGNGEMQALFRAPVQNIITALRPFVFDHVIDLARIKIAAEMRAEIG